MNHGQHAATERARRARFEALHRSHARAMLAFAVRRTGSAEDAADIVADIFLVAWRRLDEVPTGDAARLWLYGVARRITANHRRGARRRARLGDRLADAVAPNLFVDHAATGEVAAIRAALATLPMADQEVLLLVAWEGLSAADAGAVLGIPGATVRTRLHRARGRLREALADPDDAPAIPPGDERNATLRRDTADELPLVRETEAQP